MPKNSRERETGKLPEIFLPCSLTSAALTASLSLGPGSYSDGACISLPDDINLFFIALREVMFVPSSLLNNYFSEACFVIVII